MLAALVTAAALLQPPQAPAEPLAPERVAWQRSLEDALALQAQTGLPLLIAVNMDGEVFNERFAKSTYKDPQFVASTRGYICVVASPDRHTESDYDALGNRVECPRFGGCTCSEHINIEPELFRRYFNGNRNAPRHVGVGSDGKIFYDRFLDRSMQTAIDAVAEHRGDAVPTHLKAPTDVAEMFRRRDAMARSLLERRYRSADKPGRRDLLQRAATAENDPVDLLRMGLRDPDGDLVGLAAVALGKVGGSNALIDVEDALARVEDAEIRAALIAQLKRLGRADDAAARLAAHFSRAAEALPRPWSGAWSASDLDDGRAGIERALDRVEAAVGRAPQDEALRLELATAQAAFALQLMQEGGKGIEFWLADAEQNLKKVAAAPLQREAQALAAVLAWDGSDSERAQAAATASLAAKGEPREPDAWLASTFFDVLLQVLDDGRLTDGQGRTVDFRNSIMILTSNMGSQFLIDTDVPFDERKDQVLAVVQQQFRPEFLNRLDGMVMFNPLDRQELMRIARIQIEQLQRRLDERRISIELTEDAQQWLVNTGFDSIYGARPLRRLVQTAVGDKLAVAILSGDIKDGDVLTVGADPDGSGLILQA